MARLFFVMSIGIMIIKLAAMLTLPLPELIIMKGGNDANYYHCYAIGACEYAVNQWPVVLRWLNDAGIYSRNGIIIFLNLLAAVIIPLLVASLAVTKDSLHRNKIFWGMFLFVSNYPTINYLSFDIYRDVFMLFLFLLSVFVFKWLSELSLEYKRLFVFFVGMLLAYMLFLFRPYLGFGYMCSLCFAWLYSYKRNPLLLSFMCFLMILNILNIYGFFDSIISYRGMFESVDYNSNIGLDFSSKIYFTVNLVRSFLYQMLGLYFVNFDAVFLFFAESLLFISAFIFIIKNRTYSNKFVDYLVVFFIIYSFIWILGNDNLGTAVRLRMFSYISIGIAFCIIYQNKKRFLFNMARKY